MSDFRIRFLQFSAVTWKNVFLGAYALSYMSYKKLCEKWTSQSCHQKEKEVDNFETEILGQNYKQENEINDHLCKHKDFTNQSGMSSDG